MKKTLQISALLFIMLFAFQKTEAQPIDSFQVYIGDTVQNATMLYNCPASDPMYLFIYVTGSVCQSGDIINMGIDYGDGVDSTFSAQYSWGIWYNFYHTYAPGEYQLTFWGEEPGGLKDTVVMTVHVSAGCSTLTGTIYDDQDKNCNFDLGEPVIGSGSPYIYVDALNGSELMETAWVQSDGSYTFHELPDDLDYTIVPHTYYNQSSCFSGVCPVFASVPAGSSPASLDFGYFSDDSGFDLTAYTFGWGFRPGLNGSVSVNVYNHNCNVPMGGTLKVVLDPLLTYIGANQTLAGMSGDTLLFTVPTLSGSGNAYYLIIDVTTATTAVYGDPINCVAIIEPVAGDVLPLNNTSALKSDVRASWDPNDKQVSPAGDGLEGNVAPNTQLSYFIRFQNTGNAEAINIRVVDTLDSDFDLNTFQLLQTSHYCTYNFLPGNAVEFRFDNIWLPDSNSNEPGSHGSILYSVRMKPSLPEGTQFHNTAAIYFDYNAPVITNTTLNTIKIATSVIETGLNTAYVYPNPASSQLNVVIPGDFDGGTIEALDYTGRRIQTWYNVSSGTSALETAGFQSGIYIFRLTSSNGSPVASWKVTIQ